MRQCERKDLKKYQVIDLQNCNFMDDTEDEPMSANSLRSRFWCLDDCRTKHYKEFTLAYICDAWEVRFESKEDKEYEAGFNCGHACAVMDKPKEINSYSEHFKRGYKKAWKTQIKQIVQ